MRGNDLLPDEEGERKYYHVSPTQTSRSETAFGTYCTGRSEEQSVDCLLDEIIENACPFL